MARARLGARSGSRLVQTATVHVRAARFGTHEGSPPPPPPRVFRRYGDTLVNLSLVEAIYLHETSEILGKRGPMIEFWGHRLLAFTSHGSDTRPINIYFASLDEARAEFEALADVLAIQRPSNLR